MQYDYNNTTIPDEWLTGSDRMTIGDPSNGLHVRLYMRNVFGTRDGRDTHRNELIRPEFYENATSAGAVRFLNSIIPHSCRRSFNRGSWSGVRRLHLNDHADNDYDETYYVVDMYVPYDVIDDGKHYSARYDAVLYGGVILNTIAGTISFIVNRAYQPMSDVVWHY